MSVQLYPDPTPNDFQVIEMVEACAGAYVLDAAVAKAKSLLVSKASKLDRCSAVYNVRISHDTTTITGGYLYTVVAYGSAVEYAY